MIKVYPTPLDVRRQVSALPHRLIGDKALYGSYFRGLGSEPVEPSGVIDNIMDDLCCTYEAAADVLRRGIDRGFIILSDHYAVSLAK